MADPQSLASAQPGCLLEIAEVCCSAQDSVRLKRLGICEGRTVVLAQAGDPLILHVVGSRIGLSRLLAGQVMVRPVEGGVCSACPSSEV